MEIYPIRNTSLILLILLISACSPVNPKTIPLKEAFKEKFYIGVAMNGPQVAGIDSVSRDIIEMNFNAAVAENCMKSGPIHPEENTYNFELSDKFVDFCTGNGLYTVGHCLVWHSQAPSWFFTDDAGNEVSREVLIERMKAHITTVVGRYRGRVDCWDVVNEAFEDNGQWRQTRFYEIIGEEYVDLAFTFANEADPEAELLYNDYAMALPAKREAVVTLVNHLKSAGKRIDGIGMQSHCGLDYPSLEEYEKSIIAFAGTGLDIHITELDVSVLPLPENQTGADVSTDYRYQSIFNPYPNELPDSIEHALTDRYHDLFSIYLNHKDNIKRVTLWGLCDCHSWRNNWPIRGRSDYPLLFDRDCNEKPVIQDIIELSEKKQ